MISFWGWNKVTFFSLVDKEMATSCNAMLTKYNAEESRVFVAMDCVEEKNWLCIMCIRGKVIVWIIHSIKTD